MHFCVPFPDFYLAFLYPHQICSIRDGTVFGVPLSVGAPQLAAALQAGRVSSAPCTSKAAGLPLHPPAHAFNWLEALTQ